MGSLDLNEEQEKPKMSTLDCVEGPKSTNYDREEGEILDASDLEDVSDISSEEEFLLRQRIQVLENYNNALERKELKRLSVTKEINQRTDFPHISLLDDTSSDEENTKQIKKPRLLPAPSHARTHKNLPPKKPDFRKSNSKSRYRWRENHRAVHKNVSSSVTKIKNVRTVSESSAESGRENREKRRKLREAVHISRKSDNTSLKSRLLTMLNKDNNIQEEEKLTSFDHALVDKEVDPDLQMEDNSTVIPDPPAPAKEDLSDDDIEALRQLALQTKFKQRQSPTVEEIDSDTAELRLIALKSAMLKKAIERKKQRKSKRHSFIGRLSLGSELGIAEEFINSPIGEDREDDHNGTDVESVDMDIDDNVSNEENQINQAPEKDDEFSFGQNDHKLYQYNVYDYADDISTKAVPLDDIEEDEDILRAKLLTSLSIKIKTDVKAKSNILKVATPPPAPNLVINLGQSESDTDCESTRNLKVMHKKLTDQTDFQKNLDMMLKEARKASEMKAIVKDMSPGKPGVVSTTKHTPMAVKHLPRADQQEYRRLVKRMAELEKVKQARQISLVRGTNGTNSMQITVLPDHQNRKNLWTSSSSPVQTNNDDLLTHLGQAREKLSQATEGIVKIHEEIKQSTLQVQNAVKQLRLAKKNLMQKQHLLILAENALKNRQMVYRSLLKRSLNSMNKPLSQTQSKNLPLAKLQSVKIKPPAKPAPITPKKIAVTQQKPHTIEKRDCAEKQSTTNCTALAETDYQSPLIYKKINTNWTDMDPNAILCPFMVAGECKDTDCNYSHPKL